MVSSERIGLLALCSVVSLASGLLVLALDTKEGPDATAAPQLVRVSSIETGSLAPPLPPSAINRERLAAGDRSGSPLPALALLPVAAPSVADDASVVDPLQWSAVAVPTTRPSPPTFAPLGRHSVVEPHQKPLSRSVGPNPVGPIPPLRRYSLDERLAEISPGASKRLTAKFESAKAAWPPAEIALVAVKDAKTLEVFTRPAGGVWTFVHRYPVLAASGSSGPKLRQGDKQVPEGVYGISYLNPNSRFHVSLRVNYPNAFDREMAATDKRGNLGGDIMIHGKNASIGCLAIGDEAAEEIFVLAASVGISKIKLIIAPTDFRRNAIPAIEPGQPVWLPKLYTEVASAMTEFKAPSTSILLSLFGQ